MVTGLEQFCLIIAIGILESYECVQSIHQEKEAVFLLDDKRISEINMVTGRTKKKTPKLHPLLNTVVTMAASQTGRVQFYNQRNV